MSKELANYLNKQIIELVSDLKEYEDAHLKLLNRISELEDQQKTERAKLLNEHYRDKEKLYSKLLHYEDRDKIINGMMDLVYQAIASSKFEWIVTETGMSLQQPSSDLWSDELLNKIDDLFEPYTNGYRNYN
jgi:hypothetical protein